MGQLLWAMWGHYMALWSACAAFDGAVVSIVFNYPTLDMLKALPLYRPISIPGALAFVFALATFAIQLKTRAPVAMKALMYLLFSFISFLQFSTVIAGQYYLCTAIVHVIAAMQGESGVWDEDSKRKAAENRGVA